MDAMTEALRIRLREILREDMGGVYGVSVFGGISRRPTERYTVSVSFTCAPEHVDSLEKAVHDTVAAFRKGDVSQDIVDKVKEQEIRSRETDLKENGFWLNELGEAWRYGTDPRLILSNDELVQTISAKRIGTTASRYLDESRSLTGVLNPEK